MMKNQVWELAYEDGSSIFVQQKIGKGRKKTQVVFGPFLSLDEKTYTNPDLFDSDFFRPLKNQPVRIQVINLNWVKSHICAGFPPFNSDCLVLGDTLIPLSQTGAVMVDSKDPSQNWTPLAQHWGNTALRIMSASLIRNLFNPPTPS